MVARARYVARHLFLAFLLVGMLAANLDGGPGDEVLQPTFGVWIERVGLRQAWSMFAPNPTHWGSMTRAYAVTSAGRAELPVSIEPPWDRPFYRVGYDRILKIEKKVNVDQGRYTRAYAEALCRLYEVDGEVELEKVLYWVPSPSKRLAGVGRMRQVETLGRWPCR